MKKIIVLTMICALVFSMTAWGAAPETSPDNKEAAVEDAEYVPGDAELAESLEALFGDVTENSDFDPEEISALLKGLFKNYGEEEEEEHSARVSDLFDAIDNHLMEEISEYLEVGDETFISHIIGDVDEDEDGTVHLLGYFTIMNFDVDEECPDDLLVNNGIGLTELLTLELNEDGEYEVTDCITAEDSESYSDSVAEMCEYMGIDPDTFYEVMEISDLAYVSNLHNFLINHPDYDHIEYMGELVAHEDLDNIVDELFADYLAFYGLTELIAEAEAAEEAEVLSMDSADISPLGAIMLYAILDAAMDVDLEEKAAAGDDGFSEDGTVFSLLEDVLNEMSESTDEDGTEDEDTLSQLVYGLSTLGEEDEMSEEELDDLLGLMLLAIGAEEEETESEAVDLSSYSVIGYDIAAYVIAAVEANEVIAEAVEATDSTLFEILESFIDADANNADADALNARLADLEAELEKVADYIDTTEGPKHAALDLLGIVDTIADESIAYYYGHTYADAE